jgi:hypothetical protein
VRAYGVGSCNQKSTQSANEMFNVDGRTRRRIKETEKTRYVCNAKRFLEYGDTAHNSTKPLKRPSPCVLIRYSKNCAVQHVDISHALAAQFVQDIFKAFSA